MMNNIEDFKIRDCNKCKFINITESEQSKNKEPHICIKTGKRLYHRGLHPILPAFMNECPLISHFESEISINKYNDFKKSGGFNV